MLYEMDFGRLAVGLDCTGLRFGLHWSTWEYGVIR